MTKPTKWLCVQRSLRSAWASAQSDQSSLSAWRKLGSSLATHWAHCEDSDQTGQLGGCPGWSESSLGAHSFCWFCHDTAKICCINSWINMKGLDCSVQKWKTDFSFFKLLSERSEWEKIGWYGYPESNLMPKFIDFFINFQIPWFFLGPTIVAAILERQTATIPHM